MATATKKKAKTVTADNVIELESVEPQDEVIADEEGNGVPEAVIATGPDENVVNTVVGELTSAVRLMSKFAHFADQNPKETDNKYLHRLCSAATELEDDLWDSLSPAARDWVSKAADEFKAGAETVTIPSGFESKFGVRPKLAKAEKTAKAPREKKEREKKVREPKAKREPADTGVAAVMRMLVIQNPTASRAEITKLAKEQHPDFNESSIGSIYSGTHKTLRLIKKLGMEIRPIGA